jgi:hypothetical protein
MKKITKANKGLNFGVANFTLKLRFIQGFLNISDLLN